MANTIFNTSNPLFFQLKTEGLKAEDWIKRFQKLEEENLIQVNRSFVKRIEKMSPYFKGGIEVNIFLYLLDIKEYISDSKNIRNKIPKSIPISEIEEMEIACELFYHLIKEGQNKILPWIVVMNKFKTFHPYPHLAVCGDILTTAGENIILKNVSNVGGFAFQWVGKK